MDQRYTVVFEYTKESGGFKGVRTWSQFDSKEAFNDWYTPEIKSKRSILEENISDEKAIRIANQTPLECYRAAAYEEARNSKTGIINRSLLEIKLMDMNFMHNIKR